MEKILEDINLGTLIEQFKEERIDPESVASLTDRDLIRLGVQTIGDRVRLRTSCQRKLADAAEAQNSQNLTSAVLRERSTLFSLSSASTSTSRKAPGSKRKAAKRSWTVQFVCLADRYTTRVPTTTERQILHKAGLGLKKIKLDLEEDENSLREKLMSDVKEDGSSDSIGFPQLRSCGGFEMMQCVSNCRNLSIIDVNWSAKSLKSCIGGGQAKIYLRPIQKSLSTKPLADEKSESLIKERCNICHEEVLVRELRSHIWRCTDTLIQDSDDDNATTDENARASQPATLPSQNNSPDIITISDDSDRNRILVRVPASAMPIPSENETQSEDSAPIENEVEDAARKTVSYCNENNVLNPVEILRCLQKNMVIGRALDVEDPSQSDDGATNFILVDRDNLINTGFDEINTLLNLRLTVEVQFYNEGAQDLGGPRKEFFRLILKEIKEHYFDNGLRELLDDKYYIVGKIMGLSMLQNGKIPTFMTDDIIQKIFSATEESLCIMAMRNGLKEVGVYQVGHQLPIVLHLLRAVPLNTLTLRKLTNILQPCFSEEGSNSRTHENEAYAAFLKYLREVASGRRGNLSLNTVLQFCTGTDEEPILGFSLHPSLVFEEVLPGCAFLPTANTCINRMTLPRASNSLSMPLPQLDHLFSFYDYAFANFYFGNR